MSYGGIPFSIVDNTTREVVHRTPNHPLHPNNSSGSRPIEFWVDNDHKLDFNFGGSGNGGNNDDNNHYEQEQEREREKEREELERRHKEKEAELQREIESERRRFAQQQREHQLLLEIARKETEIAQKSEAKERLEKERVQREAEKNVLLHELEMAYCKINGVHIKNIKRLNEEIKTKYNDKYIFKYTQLKEEDDRLKQFHADYLNDPSIQQFVLLGKTGDGKSTFGNRLSGDHSLYGDNGPFLTGPGLHSVTSQIKRHTINNQKISILDTPGIFDTNNNDNFHLNEVVKHLRGANGINAFILCCRQGRLDSKYQEMLKDLQYMLTPTFWENVILIVTHCQDQYALHWQRSLKRELWQTINRKLELRNGAFKQYQIIGVNNNDRTSYSLCIQKLLKIVNDANKFNRRRFKSNKLISPINRLKKETVFIQNNIKALISKRNNEKSDILNCKRKLSETVNKCSSFQIDSKYTNCVNEADGILAGLSNNNYVLHDLSGINYQNEQHDDDSKYDE